MLVDIGMHACHITMFNFFSARKSHMASIQLENFFLDLDSDSVHHAIVSLQVCSSD